MKYKWDKKYLYWGVTAFCVIACSILFFSIINQWGSVRKIFHKLNDILNPIFLSLIIAYILTPVLNFLEKRVFNNLGLKAFPNNERHAWIFSRVFGIALSVLLLLSLFASILVFVLPQLYFSLQKLVHRIQDYYNSTSFWLAEFYNKDVGTETLLSGLLLKTKDYVTDWVNTGLLPRIQDILINVSSGVLGALLSIFDFFVGIILSVYVLYRKEEFIAKAKKLTYSVFSKKVTDSLISGVEHLHKTFGQYIVGKLINSVLMSLICAIFMIAFRMPYAALISVVIGATDMIPFFGPYMGTIPCFLLVLLEDPFKAVILLAFLLVLHSFNGSIMEPKIIGTSTGISGFWVLASILFFGGIFGIIGMLIGVPLFAVIYSVIGAWSSKRLRAKRFPDDTSAYEVHGPVDQDRHE